MPIVSVKSVNIGGMQILEKQPNFAKKNDDIFFVIFLIIFNADFEKFVQRFSRIQLFYNCTVDGMELLSTKWSQTPAKYFFSTTK